MAGSERWRAAPAVAATAALAVVALALGCASGGKPDPARPAMPPQTLTPPPPPQPAENPAPPPTPPTTTAALAGAPAPDTRAVDITDPPAARTDDPTLIYIDPAGDVEPPPASLAEAAERERSRRQAGPPPAVVINNTTLSDYAAGGVLTIAEPANVAGGAADDGAAAAAPDAPVGASIEESYWRQRGLEIRRRWRQAIDSIPGLVARVEELRQRFYSTDDPAYRDGEIKPLWDKALADLEEARYLAARGPEEVLAFLEEGRRAGALPGWLREGSELEPEPVVEKAIPDPAEATEPEIYDESTPEPEIYDEDPPAAP